MTPSHLQYADSLKADLLTANQPFSAEIVARLLQERAELLAACEAALSDCKTDQWENSDLAKQLQAAITKARGA